MSRSNKLTVLAFSGLAFLLAVAFSAVDARLALGAAGVGGTCAALVVGAAVSRRGRKLEESGANGAVCASPDPETAVGLIAPERASPPPPDLVIPHSTELSGVIDALFASARVAGTPVAAHLWLEDVGTPTLRLVFAVGPSAPDATPVPASEGVMAAALASGESRRELIGAIEEDGETAGDAMWRFAFPVSSDEAAGVAVVDFDAATEPDAAQLDRVTSALRGSVSGALALHVARSEAGSSRLLVEAARELSGVLDSDGVATAALEYAVKLSCGETGSVMLLDEDGRTMSIATAHGLPQDVVAATRVSEGEGIAGWVLSSGRPLVVEDLEHKGPQSRRHGVLSAVSVPISDADGVLGVLNVGSRTFHARSSRTHVRALEAIGHMTATALRNARQATVTQDLFFDTLKALALSLETRDPYARGGTARVMNVALALAAATGLDEARTHTLQFAVLLRDIGMSAAGDAVAVSNRPLTTVEWAMLKMHPRIAAEILAEAPTLGEVVPLVVHHHEHFDGNGYGEGLAGETIPLGARILSVADAYVAMTSSRPYRSAMSRDAALSELTEKAGTQFDPGVVRALVGLASRDAECLEIPT